MLLNVIASWSRSITCMLSSDLVIKGARALNQYKDVHQYMKSHCGDKTILRSSYLHNGISYTGKRSSLYRIIPRINKKGARALTWTVMTGIFQNNYSEQKELTFNTLRPRQNSRHLANNIFLDENIWFGIKLHWNLFPDDPISWQYKQHD